MFPNLHVKLGGLRTLFSDLLTLQSICIEITDTLFELPYFTRYVWTTLSQ